PFHSTPLHSIPFHSTPHRSTPLHSTPPLPLIHHSLTEPPGGLYLRQFLPSPCDGSDLRESLREPLHHSPSHASLFFTWDPRRADSFVGSEEESPSSPIAPLPLLSSFT